MKTFPPEDETSDQELPSRPEEPSVEDASPASENATSGAVRLNIVELAEMRRIEEKARKAADRAASAVPPPLFVEEDPQD